MAEQELAQQILRYIQAKDYQPRRIEQLARAMGVGQAESGDFHDACRALMKTGRVVLGGGGAVSLPPIPGEVIGSFRGNRRGFGFVIPDTPNAHGDLYVPPGKTGGAITGDTVCAGVRKRGKRHGKMLYEGVVTAVLRRGQSRFVGELNREVGTWFVLPDGNTLHVPIVVADPGAKSARCGDQVVVEIVQYPDEGVEARGVIAKVLGRRGEPGIETLSIIEQYGLPAEFDKKVRRAASQAIAAYDPKAVLKAREDLRKLTTITIDPPDARDFDDAISVVRHRDGTVELGVHIADVAHFVTPDSPLDVEARKRGNSIYLPGTVVPMLPEVLSNGLCSLQEREVRLTKSALMTYDRAGNVIRTRLANTVIRSAKRLTYQQADRILGGKPGRTSAKVVALLTEMQKLARRIHKRRVRVGMLELDLPDLELVFDEEGAVVDAVPADDSYPHKLIEMFMVEANEAVARTLSARGVPFLRRVHDEPDALARSNSGKMLRLLGHPLPDDADRFDAQRLLRSVKGKPEAFAVNLILLRSMRQAEYSPTPIGHYALASEDYCHFTSPIRRYPDLTVHRLIDRYVAGNLSKSDVGKSVPSREDLTELGNQCGTTERLAQNAERELMLVHLLRLLEKRIGDTFAGIITGVANMGLYVQIERYFVDGLVPFDQLAHDWWEVDSSRGAAVGERSGKQYKIGDRLEVTITRINLPQRRLELAPSKKPKRGRGAKHATPNRGKGKRPQRDSRSSRPKKGASRGKRKA